MARHETTIDARETIRMNLVLKVRMPRAFGLRNLIVGWLFQLAGVLSAVPIEVELQERDHGQTRTKT